MNCLTKCLRGFCDYAGLNNRGLCFFEFENSTKCCFILVLFCNSKKVLHLSKFKIAILRKCDEFPKNTTINFDSFWRHFTFSATFCGHNHFIIPKFVFSSFFDSNLVDFKTFCFLVFVRIR